MKLNKLWASVLALLALASCGKDLEPSVAPTEPQTTPVKFVNIEMTAGQGLNDLRTLFDLNDEGTPHKLFMEEKNVMIYVAVKRGDSAPVYKYSTLEFVKTPNENKATYSGQIAIPDGGSGDYKISAILLGAKGDVPSMEVRKGDAATVWLKENRGAHYHGTVQQAPKRLKMDFPYVTEWTPVVLDATNKSIKPIRLQFEPRGTVLRYRFANYTNEVKQVASVDFVSTAFATGGGVRFNFESTPGSADGNFPAMSRGYYNDFLRTFPQPVSVPAASGSQPSYSEWFYTYVCPGDVVPEYLNTTVGITLTGGARLAKVFETKQPLRHGSVRVTLPIRGEGQTTGVMDDLPIVPGDPEWGVQPKLALEYVAEHDVNNDESNPAFVTPREDYNLSLVTNIGFFNQEKALRLFKTPRMIGGKNYSLPTYEEMCSVFPTMTGRLGATKQLFGESTKDYTPTQRLQLNQSEKHIKIGEQTSDYLSDFNIVSSTLTYAVRFRDRTDYNRTAFRYQIEGNGTNRRMVVTCRYLGKDDTQNINTVSQADFWNQAPRLYVTRVFPFYGITTDSSPGVPLRGGAVFLRTQTFVTPDATFVATTQVRRSGTGSDSPNAGFCVRLWER